MLEHNGKLYARVSDVIKPFVDFSSIPEEVLNAKAALGTRVHDYIEKEIRGEMPTVGFEERGYFKSFELWRSVLNPVFLATEQRIYCDKTMLTGCIDALVQFEDGEGPVLIDWKTSANESPITWPMQAHLYQHLLKGAGHVVKDRFLFIKLDRHGALPKVFQYKFDGKILDRCLQAVSEFWKKNVAINQEI